MKKVFEIVKNFIASIKISIKVSVWITLGKFLFTGISGYLTVATTLILSEIMNRLSQENKSDIYIQIIFLLMGLGVGYCLIEVGRCLCQYFSYLYSVKMEIYLKRMLIEKSCEIDLSLFDSSDFYNELELIKGAHSNVSGLVESFFLIISCAINIVISFYLVANKSWIYGVIIVVGILPLMFLENRNIQMAYTQTKQNMINIRKQNYFFYLATDKSHALEVRLFDIKKFLSDQFLVFAKKRIEKEKHIKKNSSFSSLIAVFLKRTILLVLLASVVREIVHGNGNIGDFTVCMGLFMQLLEDTQSVVISIGDTIEYNLYVKMLYDFLGRENSVVSLNELELKEVEKIEFRDVVFKYNKSGKNVLDKVSFVIKKNDYVALIGVNGAGKSTIIKLLLRYYDPDSGEIFINDKKISEYNLKSLRKQFSVCFQNINAYGFSIRDNILMAQGLKKNCRKSDEELLEVLNATGLLEVINSSKKGLDTYLTMYFDESGIELSGGQYQRLALARSFIRNGSVMILDEPSAALDPEAEDQAFSIMEKTAKGKICLFISHRLANIHAATKIILLEEGQVLGIGTHEELIQNVKRYREIYSVQADKYK